MKAIEEGCLAMMIKSAAGNEGRVVTVGRYIGRLAGWVGDSLWEVSPPLNSVHGSPAHQANEPNLMRIDGHDATEDERVKELEYDR